MGEAHRCYPRRINFREGWRGYLWQGRFASFVMDEAYLLAAVRYVECSPVRAGLVADAGDWPWSSAKAHLSGRDDRLVVWHAVAKRRHVEGQQGVQVCRFRLFRLPECATNPCCFHADPRLSPRDGMPHGRDLRDHGGTGYPLGSAAFVERLERMVGRILRPGKPGRPSKLRKRP